MRRFLLLAAALVLAACSSASEPPATPSPTPVPSALQPGSEWVLVGPAGIDGPVTITFGEGQVSGRAPVNRYSGPFSATDAGAMKIGPLASTKMAGPPAAMADEDDYFALLGRVDGFGADDVQLVLRAGDETLLRFAPPDSPAAFGRGLIGLTVAKARAAAMAQGYEFRVVAVDGESRPVTMDYKPQRLNATVVAGRVTEVTAG